MDNKSCITDKVYHKNRSDQMPDLIAKLHQIQYLLWLRPRPHWGSLQRSLDYLAGYEWHGRRKGEMERKKNEKGKKMKRRERVMR